MSTIDTLLEQERKYRLSKDTANLKKTINALLSTCTTEIEFISMLKLLSKRKNQDYNIIKEIINALTNNTIEFYEKLLTEVIEGRLWLEDERIKISYHLRDLYIKNNNYIEALDALFKVPIETFGIPIDTLIEFQLEQLRLAVIIKEKTKQNIIEKRITKKLIDKKYILKYKLLKIDIYLQDNNYLEAVKELIEIHREIKEGELKEKIDINFIHKNIEILNKKSIINLISFLLILSKDREGRKKEMVEYAIYDRNNMERNRRYLELLVSNEIVNKNNIILFIEDILQKEYKCDDSSKIIREVVDSIDEHNIFVVSKFFISIKIDKFSYLLNLEETKLLEKLCVLVNRGKIYCRINQDKEIVSFKREEKEWSVGVRRVLQKLLVVDSILKKHKYN